MTKSIALICIALCIVCDSLAQEFIVWRSDIKLTWKDFLVKPEDNNLGIASTSSAILYKYHITDNSFVDTVVAVFYKDRSWVKHRSDRVLSHEQGHFDITEVFARKLRRSLEFFVVKQGDLKYQLNLQYYEIESERLKTEYMYDMETNHGTNKERQIYWNSKIQSELDSLAQFALR